MSRSMALRATGAVARKSRRILRRLRDPGQRTGELRRDDDKSRSKGDADRACRTAAAPENHHDRHRIGGARRRGLTLGRVVMPPPKIQIVPPKSRDQELYDRRQWCRG